MAVLNRLKAISPLFLVVVLLPTLIATAYFGLLAEDIYVSESRILVRSPNTLALIPVCTGPLWCTNAASCSSLGA